jgi:hypothetical protein
LVYPQILISQTHTNEYNSVVTSVTSTSASVEALVFDLEQKALTTSMNGSRKSVLHTEVVLCSCVKGVRHFIPSLKRGDATDFTPNSTPFEGAVVIFKYPNGVSHVAYVAKMDAHGFYIKQTNKVPCEYTEEHIEWQNPNIVGFYNPNIDVLENL